MFSCIVLFMSCTKDRTFPIPQAATGPGGKDSIVKGTLVVNEFLARGSNNYNELILPGNPDGGSDWMEVYNTTNDTILLEAGKWFVSDSIGDSKKFKLPEVNINPKSYLLLWCDAMDTVITQIHTNFSLSKDGEQLVLNYEPTSGNIVEIDSYNFGLQQSGISFGRLPDGGNNWTSFNNPTPGTANQ